MNKPTYPEVGEEFELTLTQAHCDGFLMIANFNYPNGSWKYRGQQLEAGQTARFKLEQVGACNSLLQVMEKLQKYDYVPGQWIQAFKEAYPEPDGSSVGVADCSWESEKGDAVGFPFINGRGIGYFGCAQHEIHESFRWLVRCK